MEFSRQEYGSGLPFPSPGDLPDPVLNPCLLHCRQTLYCLRHLGCHSKNLHTVICFKILLVMFLMFCCLINVEDFPFSSLYSVSNTQFNRLYLWKLKGHTLNAFYSHWCLRIKWKYPLGNLNIDYKLMNHQRNIRMMIRIQKAVFTFELTKVTIDLWKKEIKHY